MSGYGEDFDRKAKQRAKNLHSGKPLGKSKNRFKLTAVVLILVVIAAILIVTNI